MAPAAVVVKSSDLVARRIAREAYARPWLQKPISKFIPVELFDGSWCRSLPPPCIFIYLAI